MADILWVNPVGSGALDDETTAMIGTVASGRHTPVVRHLDSGPPHLEYHLYEHAAFAPMLALMRGAEATGAAAGIIGCFYDGGLRELREALTMPVIGMGEASVLLAATLGHRFSILVGRRKWIPKMEDNLTVTGLSSRLASFRSLDMGIPEMASDPDAFADRVIAASLAAVGDGAEVIVLSELVPPEIQRRALSELPVPLLDPGVATWKWAEMAADLYLALGLSHARAFGYEKPPKGGYAV